MNISKLNPRSQWDLVLCLPTSICLLLSLFFTAPSWLEWTWLGMIMLLTGIPHGATDHLVFWHKRKQEGKESSWIDFLMPYLLKIALYGLLWWIWPVLSLLTFLLLSFYHFGQSELFYLDIPENQLLKGALYIFWGAGIMAIILLGHPAESISYLEGILPPDYLNITLWQNIYIPVLGFLWGSWSLGMILLSIKGKVLPSDLFREFGVSLLLGLCLHWSSLWVGFGLYFGLWHATKAIRTEIYVLDQESETGFSIKNWILHALPFSILSFIGLALLLGLWLIWGENWHPVFLFFVGVSMLTLPHMITLEHLYKNAK